jgi:hypothetical protein
LLRFRIDSVFRITIMLLTLLHVLAFGAPAAKRFVWLIRRYPNCQSSEQIWRNKTLKYPQIVAAVRREVPEQARLTIRHDDLLLGLEVAFYAFPRRVVFETTSEVEVDRLVLRAVESNAWSLSAE